MKKIFIKRNLAYGLLVLVLLFGLFYGLFGLSKSRTFQFFGGLTSRVDTNEKVVALTFDDGPTESTDEVLDLLEKEQVKGTFYLIGESIEAYPETAKKIVALGHEIGNHTYSHERMLLKSQEFIDEEIKKTDQLIRQAGYQGEITFRPPTGKKLLGLPWYLKQHGIKTITWDVEPDTFYQEDAEAIAEYTVRNTKPGSIILIHPHCITKCEADRIALPVIIRELKSEGYRFVTMSELLKLKK